MSVTAVTPVVPEQAKDLMLTEGVIIIDEGDTNIDYGATRGGSKFDIEKVVEIVNHDGANGAVKGMRRMERFVPKLTVNLLKHNYTNLAYGNAVTVSDGTDKDGTYKEITFDLEIEDTDVLTNICFSGFKANGKYCKIKVFNALNIDSLTFEFTEKNEIVSEQIFTGFYNYATPTTPPFEILEEV